MKKLLKGIGLLLLAVVLCVIGLIVVFGFVHHRSERAVITTVEQLSPGTPFSLAIERLGQPNKTLTNSQEIVWWAEKVGSHVEARIATNSLLHTFVHRGPPFRYILVYTDREAQKVIHADWIHM